MRLRNGRWIMAESILSIRGLTSNVEDKPILKGIDLDIRAGEIHVVMGPNGAGKSTLANVLMGHPSHEATGGTVEFLGQDLLGMKVDERARAGLFLSFQHPQEVPGVTVENFLRTAQKERTGKLPGMLAFRKEVGRYLEQLSMDEKYLIRYLNQGFSGGEKKKNEILQMAVLRPRLAILDETDSGLDVDAIRSVYETVQRLSDEKNAVLVITHYSKILDYIRPDFVHVLLDGRIVETGGLELANRIDSEGYDGFRAAG